MRSSELVVFTTVSALGVLSVYTNFQQHALIKGYRELIGSTVLLRSDEYITRSVDSDEYVRGYHQATEDLGCPPDVDARNAAVDSWRKVNFQPPTKKAESLEAKQNEIAERIKNAIEPKPQEGK